VEVVVYRNVKGNIEKFDKNWIYSLAAEYDLKVEHHNKTNTNTLIFRQGKTSVNMTISSKDSTLELKLDYIRLESKYTNIIKLLDFLIYQFKLSGERYIYKNNHFVDLIYFKEGKALNREHPSSEYQFEQYLLKEAIYGHINLALDELIEVQRSGNTDRADKLKEKIKYYQEQLVQINNKL
jgi:hypothetical protein